MNKCEGRNRLLHHSCLRFRDTVSFLTTLHAVVVCGSDSRVSADSYSTSRRPTRRQVGGRSPSQPAHKTTADLRSPPAGAPGCVRFAGIWTGFGKRRAVPCDMRAVMLTAALIAVKASRVRSAQNAAGAGTRGLRSTSGMHVFGRIYDAAHRFSRYPYDGRAENTLTGVIDSPQKTAAWQERRQSVNPELEEARAGLQSRSRCARAARVGG